MSTVEEMPSAFIPMAHTVLSALCTMSVSATGLCHGIFHLYWFTIGCHLFFFKSTFLKTDSLFIGLPKQLAN